MGQTVPGGYYIGSDGRPHDAHGNRLDAPAEAPKRGKQIPSGFPGRKDLIAAGISDLSDVPTNLDSLIAIKGIGVGTAEKILAKLEAE